MLNPILSTDSYKASHYLQYPPGTTRVSSYIEARGVASGFLPPTVAPKIVHFGLQAFLYQLQAGIDSGDIDEAEAFLKAHGLPFNRAGWEIIANEHAGLPIRIQSVPEGKAYPIGTPVVQIVNTDPRLPWLTSYLETAMLRAVWYPSTVATISRSAKQIIARYMDITAGHRQGLEFKLHDFGGRGVSSGESAGIGGAAHLVNFMGTDTIEGILWAQAHYNMQFDQMLGFSIPAAEHSTITAWGRENEVKAFENMLTQFAGPGKLVAVVSDSYDIYEACDKLWGQELRQKVIDSGATVVIRPDSGDPTKVPLECLEILGSRFGWTSNQKGYKVLPSCVRVIQGDGINLQSIASILSNLEFNGWSAENIAFGMGGALLQQCNRDTFKWAMKASAVEVDGNWRDVFKDPVTDPGKVSKKGVQSHPDFIDVFVDGEIKNEWTFDQVRANAAL